LCPVVKVILKNVALLTIIFCFARCLLSKDTLLVCLTLIIAFLYSSNFSVFGDSEIKTIKIIIN
jgi:hypothetical protein